MIVGIHFSAFAELCRNLEKTSKRTEKTRLMAAFLKNVPSDEIIQVVSFMSGRVFPESDKRVLDMGGLTLWRLAARRSRILINEPVTISDIARTFDTVSSMRGHGSRGRKERLLLGLLSRMDKEEITYLVRLVSGEMRIGAVEGLVIEAISEASGIESDVVQRANMLLGSLGDVAKIALTQGVDALKSVTLRVFTAVKPMLAEMSSDVQQVLDEHGGETAFEWKIDGARVQMHIRDRKIMIFSRRLSEVSESVPDIVELILSVLPHNEIVLEGEIVAIGNDGRPMPFQDLMRRFGRKQDLRRMGELIPLRLFVFDMLYKDGVLLIDYPYKERWSLLSETIPQSLLIPQIVTASVEEAQEFLNKAVHSGHEGLMGKALCSSYTPGTRGKKWLKVKPYETLDLAIIAADWGYGRRSGWLSDYHLGVKDDRTGELLSLGKTFKGLTDKEFAEITEKLLRLKTAESEYTVFVRPEIVVEVAYNEIQRSRRYRSGHALRFARISRIRYDKSSGEVDTLSHVRDLYDGQFKSRTELDSKK